MSLPIREWIQSIKLKAKKAPFYPIYGKGKSEYIAKNKVRLKEKSEEESKSKIVRKERGGERSPLGKSSFKCFLSMFEAYQCPLV